MRPNKLFFSFFYCRQKKSIKKFYFMWTSFYSFFFFFFRFSGENPFPKIFTSSNRNFLLWYGKWKKKIGKYFPQRDFPSFLFQQSVEICTGAFCLAFNILKTFRTFPSLTHTQVLWKFYPRIKEPQKKNFESFPRRFLSHFTSQISSNFLNYFFSSDKVDDDKEKFTNFPTRQWKISFSTFSLYETTIGDRQTNV